MGGKDAAEMLSRVFGGIEVLKGKKDEAACLTEELTTAQMEKLCASLGDVRSCMRVL